MKGFGTIRRAVVSALAFLQPENIRSMKTAQANSPSTPLTPEARHGETTPEAGRFTARRMTRRKTSRTKVKGVFIHWGDLKQNPFPLSRKQLKRICPNHPLIVGGWR
jgi:hypothetical protein